MTDRGKTPLAMAIFYTNYTESYGFSDQELLEFLMLLTIPAFFDILITKYEDHIEFMINVNKTNDPTLKIYRMSAFHHTIDLLSNVDYETLENTYVVGKKYDCLTAKCKLNAINN